MATTRKSPITCHVLDSSTGKPAQGVEVRVQQYRSLGEPWHYSFDPIAYGKTDSDGRCMNLMDPQDGQEALKLSAGIYKVVFKTKNYFEVTKRKCFYPWVEINFELEEPTEHYHIPLLISPYSFTTYRGS